jgi:diphthine-ammonia ligase
MVEAFLKALSGFKLDPVIEKSENEIIKDLEKLITSAVERDIPNERFGIMFSGGIDSTLIAYLCKKLGKDFKCYVAGLENAKDVLYAQKVAKELDLELESLVLDLDETEKYIKEILPIIKSNNVVKMGVALPVYACAKKAKEDGIKVLFTGLGSEEIFAGYERHKKSTDLNVECLNGLNNLKFRDLDRDLPIATSLGLDFKVPFLDVDLIEYSLRIPGKFKLDENHSKVILRKTAVSLGLNEEFSFRKKIAAQYGSKFDKAIKKLATRNGFEFKLGYLNSLFNIPIGVLCSGGKDSWLSALRMKENGFDLSCLITLKSLNKDSFMFHSANIDLVELQSEASSIPLLIGKTEGVKEDELKDLEKIILEAKNKYGIGGICTGALYSNYQKKRIGNICNKLELECYNPLWQMDQEGELIELVEKGFDVILSAIASDGMDASWLGRKLDLKMIEALRKLNSEVGMNVAGEGGEFESLVLGCPLFKGKIKVLESESVMDGECRGFYIIKKAQL